MDNYILIIDDDNFISKVMTECIERAGLTVDRARDSVEAMEIIYAHAPSLILLDVELPDKNGYEILRILRNDTRTSHVPIIMVSARNSVQDKVKGLELGADDYLVKPFAPDELIARIKSLLRRVKHEKSFNPLTGLPGNKLIEEQLHKIIAKTHKKAIVYIDIDNFKAYNDTYGFLRGDEVITLLADITKQSMTKYEPDGFFGHVGGDDFIMLTKQEHAEAITIDLLKLFESIVPLTYDLSHRKFGFIETKDRQGNVVKFSFMTLSIAILMVDSFDISIHDISTGAAKLKHEAKLKNGNSFVVKKLA